MSQAFYRKWRPRQWAEVVAQEHVITTLRNAVKSGRVGHAYLFAGPRGTGKTTTARLLAKALNCLDPDPANRPCDQCEHCQAISAGRFLDLIEIDAASNTSVDDVRSLREKINFSPSQGRFKVYIIDEVHMLSTAAFNALLKTLEEPPAHAIFILATTEVHKIPATVLSRCQRHEFRRIPVEEIKKHLRDKAGEEGIEVDDAALTLIARQATGAMRDAISLLDQLASTGHKVTLQEAQEVLGAATSKMVTDLVDALLAKDAPGGLQQIQMALDSGSDARQFARQVVDYLRNVLLVKLGTAEAVDATLEQRDLMNRHARAFDHGTLLEAIRLFNTAAVDTRSSWHPGLALELAFVEGITTNSPAQTGEVVYQSISAPVNSMPEKATPAKPVPPKAEPPVEPPAPAPTAQKKPEAPASSPAASSKPAPSTGTKHAAEPPARTPAPSQQPVQPPAAQQSAKAAPTPPKPEANQTAAPASGEDRSISAQELQQNWARIRAMIKKRSRSTDALLNSCKTSLKEKTITFAFVSDVLKSKMETAENLEIVRQSIQAILGVSLNIRCVVTGSRTAQPEGLDADGVVGTALELGGKIIHQE